MAHPDFRAEPAHPGRTGAARSTRAPKLATLFLLLCNLLVAQARGQTTHTPTDMLLTKHNLSVSGTGTTRALSETRICVFCHTPHNGSPLTPLWNKELEPRSYAVYSSPTLKSGPLPQPSGATKLCLTCHDGMLAMGAVLNPATGIPMAGGNLLPPGSLANFGLDLSGHHPVSFSYQTALPNTELAPSPPPDLVYGNMDEVHCTTCHDPHNDQYGMFLLKDNRFSALCTTCHQMDGWNTSLHATSDFSVVGILPRPPQTWPAYTHMNEWGCETCHTPHFAPTAEYLLNFTDDPPAPFTCTTGGCHGSQAPPFHNLSAGAGNRKVRNQPAGGMADIDRQIRKPSAHHQAVSGGFTAASNPASRTGVRSVACADCHNPHALNDQPAEAPYASGMLRGTDGVDRNGAEVARSTYEYEVCFKCHGDNSGDVGFISRVVPTANKRLAFQSSNSSYHPVVAIGRNLDIPSIPSSFEPSMTAADQIYCSTCHSDDEGGVRGPHGSTFTPILRRRYETADRTPESLESYALCYQCHERSSILSDESFRRSSRRTTVSGGGHSGHLAAGAPCSACHDAHGVDNSSSAANDTGSHTHLINFDTSIVQPAGGRTYPIFIDANQPFAGSCTLVCHGVEHDNASYP